MTPDQHRPDTATQRATLAVARAVLAADPEAAALAVMAAPCPACLAISATQFGFTLALTVSGRPVMDEVFARGLAAAVEVAQRELDAAPN